MRRLLASWFGTGLLVRRLTGNDRGSGTLAAALTLPVAVGLGRWGWPVQTAAAVAVAVLSWWAVQPFLGEADADPGWVVVDEAAGTVLAVIGLPWGPALVGFLVFRLADISKRFPGVAAAERLPGAMGITADDLVAGGWGLLAGWIVFRWGG